MQINFVDAPKKKARSVESSKKETVSCSQDKIQETPRTSRDPLFLIDLYEASLEFDTIEEIAARLNMARSALDQRMEAHPLFKTIRDRAHLHRLPRKTVKEGIEEYALGKLSVEARATWDRLQDFLDEKNTTLQNVQDFFETKASHIKKECFLQAILKHDFSIPDACNEIGISYKEGKGWMDNDPDFLQLAEEILFYKKDIIESSLISLVKRGHPGATIFASRTLNGDRGYSEKMRVEHTGTVEVNHNMIDIDTLDIDIQTKMKIRDAMRKLKENSPVIDVTPVQKALTE